MSTYVVTSYFWQIIDHWQTLIAGILALAAAVATIIVLRQQINQTQELVADQRNRRARAAQAVLPLALSELADYSIACVKGLCTLERYFTDEDSLDRSRAEEAYAAWTSPNLPENVLSILKECIEFAGDKPAAALAELIRHLQIQKTRLVEDISRLRLNDGVHTITKHDINQAIRDSAEIYARAMPIFIFARGHEVENFEINSKQIRDALSSSSCFYNDNKIESHVSMWKEEFSFRVEMQKQGNKSIGL